MKRIVLKVAQTMTHREADLICNALVQYGIPANITGSTLPGLWCVNVINADDASRARDYVLGFHCADKLRIELHAFLAGLLSGMQKKYGDIAALMFTQAGAGSFIKRPFQ